MCGYDVYILSEYSFNDADVNDTAAAADSRATNDDVSGNRKKKSRTVFSRRQVLELETTFAVGRYLSSVDRCRLAARLQLSETQVKIWFQNRRNKWKRQSNVATAASTTQAQCLRALGVPDEEDSAWNGGGGGGVLMVPPATRAVAKLSAIADKYNVHLPRDAAYHRRLLSPVTVSACCNLLPLRCPVVSFRN